MGLHCVSMRKQMLLIVDCKIFWCEKESETMFFFEPYVHPNGSALFNQISTDSSIVESVSSTQEGICRASKAGEYA